MSWQPRDRDRHCLMLTQFTAHVEVLAELLRDAGEADQYSARVSTSCAADRHDPGR